MTSTAAQKALLALCIVFILAGLGLTIAGVFSPAWQVVDIREFRAEHQVSFFEWHLGILLSRICVYVMALCRSHRFVQELSKAKSTGKG
uniref:Claudin-34 n=1 Tax=Ascaris lumbricoides TaxID=6252 RepID=A0A0M3HP01_ASCLU